jgi:adenylosuccinate lyase
LKDVLLQDSEVSARFAKGELEKLFSLDYHLKYIGTIFKRVLKRS